MRAHGSALETWLPPLALLVWSALVVTLLLHHEPWRDEADTWLAARDLSPAGLWRFAGYVGSPTLWYWLQMPLAKLGAPYASLGFLNACCAAVGIGLFLWRAPFAWWMRLLFAFSYFGSYEYAVIARSYALGMALLFGLAAIDRARFARPLLHGTLVALLVNTSVHGLIVGVPILAAFAWEAWRIRNDRGPARAVADAPVATAPAFDAVAATRPAAASSPTATSPAFEPPIATSPRTAPIRLAAAIGFAGLILAIVQLLPPPDGQLTGIARWIDGSLLARTLAGALFPTAEAVPIAMAAAALLWLAVATTLLRSRRALFTMVTSSAGLWLLFLLKYRGELRHWGFLLLAMLYALWIARSEEVERPRVVPATAPAKRSRPDRSGESLASRAEAGWTRAARVVVDMGLPVALAWSVYVAADYWRRDLRDPFSASRAAARWLSASGLTRIPIAAWPSAQAEALLPYLPGVRFYDPGIRDYGTHLRWDRATITGWDLPEDQVLKRTIEAFPRGDLVLLVDRPFRFAERAGFGLVHAEVGSVMMGDEQYFVYRRGPVSRAP